MPKTIPIDDATDGMVLAAGVEDKMGRPILKTGDVIKASFVDRLKRWGIVELVIQVDGEEADSSESEVDVPLDSSAIDKHLNEKFRGHPLDSHMQVVRDCVRKILTTERLNF